MCKVLQVSETGYYKWLKHQSMPDKYDALLAKILQIRTVNPDCGAYRIHLHLKLYQNYTGSYYLILKLCKTHHLMLKKKHHTKGITKADPAAQASANLIKQDFTATLPNQKWLGDITGIPTSEGKLYVAVVMDCFDGTIVGLKMADHMRADVLKRLPPELNVSSLRNDLHSDRCSQDCSCNCVVCSLKAKSADFSA